MRKFLFINALLLLQLCPHTSSGQLTNPANDKPSQREKLTGRRVMQQFDFEERKIHFLKHPMYWQKIEGGLGFPQDRKSVV